MGDEGVDLYVFLAYCLFIETIKKTKWWERDTKGLSHSYIIFETIISKILIWYNDFDTYGPYLLSFYLYVRTHNLWPIFGLTVSNKNVFESITILVITRSAK